MKSIVFVFVVLAGLFTACSNEFEFNAPRKEIPIVYSMLDTDDPVHYVRLERAFLSQDQSALDVARIPDSLYYENAVVELIDENDNRYSMERVDATLEGFPRNEGVFAETPNYIYKIENQDINLVEGESLRLEIETGEVETIKSTAILIKDIEMREPFVGNPASFLPKKTTRIRWKHLADDENRVYIVSLTFNYQEEEEVNSGVYIDKSFKIKIAELLNDDRFEFDGSSFYDALVGNINSDLPLTRLIGKFEIEVIAGGSEVSEAIRIENANTGITSSQEIPVFSNIEPGLGLFSSRKTHVEFYDVTGTTRDTIRFSELTKDLNFL